MNMVDSTIMAAKPVQISIDRELLARIDRDPQTKKQGRSAFIRDAVELYLAAKRRRGVDRQIALAYRDRSRELLADVEPWLGEQAWPEK
jgi:metal-responsive CopG/Arc/MetJ family transcriptional regulator